jgi:hypothetical protein
MPQSSRSSQPSTYGDERPRAQHPLQRSHGNTSSPPPYESNSGDDPVQSMFSNLAVSDVPSSSIPSTDNGSTSYPRRESSRAYDRNVDAHKDSSMSSAAKPMTDGAMPLSQTDRPEFVHKTLSRWSYLTSVQPGKSPYCGHGRDWCG